MADLLDVPGERQHVEAVVELHEPLRPVGEVHVDRGDALFGERAA